jgi:hypothetical protein
LPAVPYRAGITSSQGLVKVSGGPNLGTFLLKLYLAGPEVQRDTARPVEEPDVARWRRVNGLGASLAVSGVIVFALVCASFPSAPTNSTASNGGANGGGGPVKHHYHESVPQYSVRKDKRKATSAARR